MTRLPRRFHLWRDEDENGASGTGRVVEGVQFTDGTVALRWRTERRSTAVYDSINDVEHIHGHDGKTRVVWDDVTGPPPADYASVWTELRGYVQEAVDDGGPIDPANLLAYLDELKARAVSPARDWIRRRATPPPPAP